MKKKIVVVNQDAGTPQILPPLAYSDIGVRELQDIEEWVKRNPEILGEKLLIITSEFDRFDKSDKRLDLLALDAHKKVVVIEIKRDAAGTLADLQAIRYAAFVSTLTFPQIAEIRANYMKTSVEVAEQEIRDFVGDSGFSEVDNKPRIILAAGGFDDPELTSAVLWLRKFGVDVSCVEICPYRVGDGGPIIIVPRVLIPLPEAADYIVGVERKEAEQSSLSETKRLQLNFWQEFVEFCSRRGAIPELIGEPQSVGWYHIELNVVGVWLELKATTRPPALTAQLVIQNTTSKSTFKLLEESKDEIEGEIGAPLEWEEPLEDGRRGKVFQVQPAQIELEEEWPRCFEWLKDRGEAFYRVFSCRVQKLG